jgi:uncharacterized DUF497 family protein
MKKVEWNEEKNKSLIEIRGVSFEEVVEEMVQNRIIRIFQHQNQIRYPNQQIMLVYLHNYIYSVPYVEDESKIFLKTIYPSRKWSKILLGDKNEQS